MWKSVHKVSEIVRFGVFITAMNFNLCRGVKSYNQVSAHANRKLVIVWYVDFCSPQDVMSVCMF